MSGPGRTWALAGAQAAIGAITFLRAPRTASQPWLGLSDTAVGRVVRVLGARQAAQALALVAIDDPAALALGSAVDATHALTMVPVALWPGPYRRAAAISAVLAATMAVAELNASRSGS